MYKTVYMCSHNSRHHIVRTVRVKDKINMWRVVFLTLFLFKPYSADRPYDSDDAVPVEGNWTELHKLRPIQVYFVGDTSFKGYSLEDIRLYGDSMLLYNIGLKVPAPKAKAVGAAVLSEAQEQKYLPTREGLLAGTISQEVIPGTDLTGYLQENEAAFYADLVVFMTRFHAYEYAGWQTENLYPRLCSNQKFHIVHTGLFDYNYFADGSLYVAVTDALTFVEPFDADLGKGRSDSSGNRDGVVIEYGEEAYRRILKGNDDYKCYYSSDTWSPPPVFDIIKERFTFYESRQACFRHGGPEERKLQRDSWEETTGRVQIHCKDRKKVDVPAGVFCALWEPDDEDGLCKGRDYPTTMIMSKNTVVRTHTGTGQIMTNFELVSDLPFVA
ncbi:uncharacterized protein LOC135373231 isoform X3 [Ornithodoros turicata]|uniref:uncharacterized protein LOC135373231 isoform X3 n=1 Tax=Ornithodoros turicata TaxID=34597 RepID=UPI0031389EF2